MGRIMQTIGWCAVQINCQKNSSFLHVPLQFNADTKPKVFPCFPGRPRLTYPRATGINKLPRIQMPNFFLPSSPSPNESVSDSWRMTGNFPLDWRNEMKRSLFHVLLLTWTSRGSYTIWTMRLVRSSWFLVPLHCLLCTLLLHHGSDMGSINIILTIKRERWTQQWNGR